MEYLPGGSLHDVLGQGPLSWVDVLDYGVKLAGALESSHREGVLHRDVKPENVMLSAWGEPHLGDFGIARVKGAYETAAGKVTATLVARRARAARRPVARSVERPVRARVDALRAAGRCACVLGGGGGHDRSAPASGSRSTRLPTFARAACPPRSPTCSSSGCRRTRPTVLTRLPPSAAGLQETQQACGQAITKMLVTRAVETDALRPAGPAGLAPPSPRVVPPPPPRLRAPRPGGPPAPPSLLDQVTVLLESAIGFYERECGREPGVSRAAAPRA